MRILSRAIPRRYRTIDPTERLHSLALRYENGCSSSKLLVRYSSFSFDSDAMSDEVAELVHVSESLSILHGMYKIMLQLLDRDILIVQLGFREEKICIIVCISCVRCQVSAAMQIERIQ